MSGEAVAARPLPSNVPRAPIDVMRALDATVEALRRWRKSGAGPDFLDVAIPQAEVLRDFLIRPEA